MADGAIDDAGMKSDLECGLTERSGGDGSQELVRFKRNHFSTRLPRAYTYSLSHYWLSERTPGTWRIGLTSFATRMLGEIVEFELEVAPGGAVSAGNTIGWIEGFKAVSDIYCVGDGSFLGANTQTPADFESICRDPYGDGWLYEISGRPDPAVVDVDGYIEHLNRTIDKMLEQPWKSGDLNSSEDSGSA